MALHLQTTEAYLGSGPLGGAKEPSGCLPNVTEKLEGIKLSFL